VRSIDSRALWLCGYGGREGELGGYGMEAVEGGGCTRSDKMDPRPG
jgi:hypothetical protein